MEIKYCIQQIYLNICTKTRANKATNNKTRSQIKIKNSLGNSKYTLQIRCYKNCLKLKISYTSLIWIIISFKVSIKLKCFNKPKSDFPIFDIKESSKFFKKFCLINLFKTISFLRSQRSFCSNSKIKSNNLSCNP